MTTENKWVLIASNDAFSYVAQTITNNDALLYRAITKWLIRGNASNMFSSFWEYIDQYDNEIENALLDQLVTQADIDLDDPQITTVKTKDYSINITVKSRTNSELIKNCSIEFVLFVNFHSLKKKICIDTQTINLSWTKFIENIENIDVNRPTKTPHHLMNKKTSKRTSKKSSKRMPNLNTEK